MTPFNFLNSINNKTEYLMSCPELEEKDYVPYVVNRTLSYFPDTIFFANEMNLSHHIDKKLQYDFLYNVVRKRKRFSKWASSEVECKYLDSIKNYYKVNNERAKEYSRLLSEEEKEMIHYKVNRGGSKKVKKP